MKNKWKLITAVFVIFIFVGGTGFIVYSQINNVQQGDSSQLRKMLEKSYPIADYNSADPTDPNERDLRHRRNAKFDIDSRKIRPEQLESLQLNEKSPEFFITTSLSGGIKSAFPISASEFILVGKAIDSKAFLSNDRTNVYSEFSFGIDGVLKKPLNTNLQIGNTISLVRYGGKVRLPSGKILFRANIGNNMPEVGKTYLVFLREDKETQTFGIVTAYELRSGTVVPLDGEPDDGFTEPSDNPFKYNGFDVTNFINIVNTKIIEEGRKKQ